MRTGGVVLCNTSLIGAAVSEAQEINVGFEGSIIVSSQSGLDPDITQLNVALKLGGLSGSGYVIVHSSRLLANNCTVSPVSLPAGEYVVRTLGGSSVVGAYVAIMPSF